MGGGIDAMERDVRSQVGLLGGYSPLAPLPEAAQRRAVFCGSGDSLASCMLAEAHSGLRARAADPLDAARNPGILRGRDAYVVSVSGRTAANVRAARLARRAVAVTASPGSPLARACGRTVPLRFPNSDAVTGGTASFLDSALACVSLVSRVRVRGAAAAFRRAEEDAASGWSGRGRVFFLGGLHTYPLAMYAAAKVCEVSGGRAYYERTEQFPHMGLFSSRAGDEAVILEERSAHARRLESELSGAGLRVVRPRVPGPSDRVLQLLYCAFYAQLGPLLAARRAGRRECHFIESRALRGASDRMIYVRPRHAL